jgi:hypothetical protein
VKNRPFSHIVQMLPGAELVKSGNQLNIRENLFFVEMLALDEKAPE